MRIPSGKTDQAIYFVAVDSTDLKTRKTGLSAFTVYRSRNGGTATVYTTPTIVELSASNMPGVYSLLIDEDTTVASTSDAEEYALHITCATMAPVTRVLELFRRDATSGRQLLVDANGRVNVAAIAGTAQTAGNVIAKLPAALISGRMDVTVGAMQANVMTAAAAATDMGQEFADTLLDRTAGVETGLTFRQAMRLMAAVLLGKGSGLGTTTAVYRDTGDTKDRVTATVTAAGDRTAVTLDAS